MSSPLVSHRHRSRKLTAKATAPPATPAAGRSPAGRSPCSTPSSSHKVTAGQTLLINNAGKHRFRQRPYRHARRRWQDRQPTPRPPRRHAPAASPSQSTIPITNPLSALDRCVNTFAEVDTREDKVSQGDRQPDPRRGREPGPYRPPGARFHPRILAGLDVRDQRIRARPRRVPGATLWNTHLRHRSGQPPRERTRHARHLDGGRPVQYNGIEIAR